MPTSSEYSSRLWIRAEAIGVEEGSRACEGSGRGRGRAETTGKVNVQGGAGSVVNRAGEKLWIRTCGGARELRKRSSLRAREPERQRQAQDGMELRSTLEERRAKAGRRDVGDVSLIVRRCTSPCDARRACRGCMAGGAPAGMPRAQGMVLAAKTLPHHGDLYQNPDDIKEDTGRVREVEGPM